MPSQEAVLTRLSEVPLEREPFRILAEKAEALREETNSILYGELIMSPTLSRDEVTCDFYIIANAGDYRYLLLDSTVHLNADYPVRVYNSIAGVTTQIHNAADYKRHINRIFNAPATIVFLRNLQRNPF